jgi:hypothetical protein
MVIYDVTERFHGSASQGWVITIADDIAPGKTQLLSDSPLYATEAEARAAAAELGGKPA